MRYYPEDEYGFKELEELGGAPQWMIDCLKLNPSYCVWGNFENYMHHEGDGWDAPIEYDSPDDLKTLKLDDLNEIVNFYFEIDRNTERCAECEGSGLGDAAKELADSYYDFEETGNRWCDKLTQDEVDYLRDMGQLSQFDRHPTASEVNAIYPAGIDAYRDDLIKFRAKKQGIWEMCPVCNGHGYVYRDSEATLRLQLWILHPRNGCSRGVYVRNVAQADLQDIFELLRKADQRNRARFAKV